MLDYMSQFDELKRFILKLKVTGGLGNISFANDSFLVFKSAYCMIVMDKNDCIQFKIIKDGKDNYLVISTTKKDLLIVSSNLKRFNNKYALSLPYRSELRLSMPNHYPAYDSVLISYKGTKYECISSESIRLGEIVPNLPSIRLCLHTLNRGMYSFDIAFDDDKTIYKLYSDDTLVLRFKDEKFNLCGD